MKDTPLNRFVEEVVGMGNGYMGMGHASLGIVGATTANEQVFNELRKNVLDFASEYTKSQPNHEKILEYSGKLEASLQTAKVFYGLSDAKLDTLLNDLDALLEP